ncbi:MAG: hypothetical protein ACR2QR_07360 [Woeseiaceae bacterium]
MGTVVSGLVEGAAGIVSSLAGVIADNPEAVRQVGNMAGQFAKQKTQQDMILALRAGLDVPIDYPSIVLLEQTDGHQAAQAALKGGKQAASAKYKAAFSEVPAAGVDGGYIQGYNAGGDPSSAIKQMQTAFQNWNIPTIHNTPGKMMETIQTQVAATMGQTGTAHGRMYINQNQSICWVVAYGEFAVSETANGLIYAFTAGLDSGWG